MLQRMIFQSAMLSIMIPACTGGSEEGEESVNTKVLVSGIEDGGEPSKWHRICDGSMDLRFAMATVGGGPEVSEMVRWNGWSYLYVRGDCRYWAYASELPFWQWDTQTGVLDAALEEEMSRFFDYGYWKPLAGVHHEFSDCCDLGSTLWFDGRNTVRCIGACSVGAAEVQGWRAERQAWIKKLEALGETYVGPLWIDIIRSGDWSPEEWEIEEYCLEHLRWPLAEDPNDWAQMVATDKKSERNPLRIEDPMQVELLKAAREKFRQSLIPDECNTAKRSSFFLFTYGSEPTQMFSVWMRDALPVEGEGGQVPLKVPMDDRSPP